MLELTPKQQKIVAIILEKGDYTAAQGWCNEKSISAL